MAKNEPYLKFNNIQHKIKVEEYIGREVTKEDLKDPEYHKIVSTIMKRNIKYGVDSLTHLELEGLKPTLGIELETVSGRLTEEDYKDLNFKAVHDGSLRDGNGNEPTGGEYVTGVLYGDAGFAQFYKICQVLNKNTDVDHRAGVHVHIGSLNWSNEDIVYSYILAQMVENEMYAMLPKSRIKNTYCRKITKLFNNSSIKQLLVEKNTSRFSYETLVDEFYNTIFLEVSGGIPQSVRCNTSTNHPKGSKCNYDKNSQRYCWLNYVTLLFNTKSNPNARTLEIRSHSATLNYTKIKNWIKIWVAFCNFVQKEKKAIVDGYFQLNGKTVPVNLETICLYSYPKKGQKLVDYIQSRKETFKTADESIDYPTVNEPNKTIKEVLSVN